MDRGCQGFRVSAFYGFRTADLGLEFRVQGFRVMA